MYCEHKGTLLALVVYPKTEQYIISQCFIIHYVVHTVQLTGMKSPGFISCKIFLYSFLSCGGRIHCDLKYIIRESVDSLCRDDAYMPMTPYIRKACNRPNAAFVSLFR